MQHAVLLINLNNALRVNKILIFKDLFAKLIVTVVIIQIISFVRNAHPIAIHAL